MTTILRIDSSSRTTESRSRELGDHFERAWRARHPSDRFLRRDLAAQPITHITDTTIAGFYAAAGQLSPAQRAATALSDELIAELQSAQVLLLTVPMYNFSLPSALKAWIDQIVRVGKTFTYDGTKFAGLVTVQHAYIFCAYGAGGYTDGGPFSAFNFLEPYLKSLFGFLGIPDVQFFAVQGTTLDLANLASNLARSKQHIDSAIAHA